MGHLSAIWQRKPFYPFWDEYFRFHNVRSEIQKALGCSVPSTIISVLSVGYIICLAVLYYKEGLIYVEVWSVARQYHSYCSLMRTNARFNWRILNKCMFDFTGRTLLVHDYLHLNAIFADTLSLRWLWSMLFVFRFKTFRNTSCQSNYLIQSRLSTHGYNHALRTRITATKFRARHKEWRKSARSVPKERAIKCLSF